MLHKIHQVVVHETRMRIVILGIHEAETILLVERDCIQVGIDSKETEINMHSDCHSILNFKENSRAGG